MRCLSFFGHPCLCLQIPSFQGLGGIFTRWILAMPGTLRSFSPPSVAAFPRYRSALSSGDPLDLWTVLRLAHQKQASCLLLVCRLRSFSPPSVAAFLRYCSALSTGCESLDSHTRSKPPACCWCAAFVRFRRHPWRLFLAIARHSLREASLRLAHQKQASCLLLVCRLRSFSPPSVAAFPRYRSALSTGGESTTRLPPPTALPKCSRSLS